MSDALKHAANIADLRLIAKRRLPRAIFDFFDGGAEDETTLRGNREAFERVRLRPKVLVNVAEVDTKLELLGGPAASPIVIAPTGAIGIGRRGAEIMIARAAKAMGIPFTLATPAMCSIEEVAEQAGGRLWFQLYVLRNLKVRERLIARAEAAGYEALVLTVDLPVGGKRERDLRNDFASNFKPSWRNSRDMWAKPAWLWDMARHGMPQMANLEGLVASSTKATDVASSVGREMDASFDWDELAKLRERWPRKLVVKGVERGDDAMRLASMGVDAIVVSNHGGRQLDGALGTLDAVPDVVQGAGGKVPVLVDSGVRRGVDVLKARALGATAVQVGRATLYGVMAGGEEGAARALSILQGEFVRAMQLCGARNLAEITPDLVAR